VTAAGVWYYKKCTLKVSEEPGPVQEKQIGGEWAKKIDDETCEAENCEMENMEDGMNLYTNAPGNKTSAEQKKLAD
jgi:hypothetical protein